MATIKGITIEIGANTTELSKALSDVNKDIKSTQNELREVEKLLKLDPKNTELLEQKQKLLKQAITETKEKLDVLKNAEAQVEEQFKRGEVSEEQYRALKREIEMAEISLNKLEEAAKQSNSELAKAGETFGKIGETSTNIGKKMLPATTAIIGAGTACGAMASSFEDAMAKVSTIAETTEVPLEDLKASILDLSDETGIAATDIAENVYNAISAGQKTGDAVNFVSNATKLAKAGFTDSSSALDILTTAMNAYGMEAEEVNRVSDLLIQTQNLGKTTVGELSSSMGKVIPTAKANNVEIDQLCAGYAILTANGIATAESTTYMNSMLNELGKGGTKVDKILRENTGQSFAELSQSGKSVGDVLQILNDYAEKTGVSFSDLWGSAEAGKAGLVLLGDGADSFNGKLAEMNNATGATDSAFEKLDTTSYKIQKSINQLKNTAISLGTTLLTAIQPIIERVSKKVEEFTTWFKGLNSAQQETIIKVAAVVAAIGPALIVFGKICTSISSIISLIGKMGPAIKAAKAAFAALNAVLAANPIILVIGVIAALIAIIVTLYNKCEWFRDFIDKALDQILGFFQGLWNGIVGVFSGAGTWFKEKFTEAYNFVVNAWSGLGNYFSNKYQSIKNTFSTVKDFFRNTFSNAWTAVQNVFSNWTSFFTGLWSRIRNTFSNLGSSIASAISSSVKSGINGIIRMIENTINRAISIINGAIGLINKIPGVSVRKIGELSLPKLAKGGILSQGRAIVAEEGPEIIEMVNGRTIVTPLTDRAKNTSLEKLQQRTQKTDISINIENFHNNRKQDVKELAEEILQYAEEIKEGEERVYA